MSLQWHIKMDFFTSMLMWCNSSWGNTTPTCESADWGKTEHIILPTRTGVTAKLWYFPTSVWMLVNRHWFNQIVFQVQLWGTQWFCYSGGFSTGLQLLEKLLDVTVCFVIICAIPILATRVPQKARNSLWQLGQRELQSHWIFSEATFFLLSCKRCFFLCNSLYRWGRTISWDPAHWSHDLMRTSDVIAF